MIGFAMVTAATAQQSFKTPQEAVETLVTAVRAGDRKAVDAILGPGAEQIISSGDAVQDENTRKVFLAAYDAKHSVANQRRQAGHAADRSGRLSVRDSDREKGRLVDVRHRGRPRGGSRPPHWPQRTRRDPGLPRLLRCPVRIRRDDAEGRRHGGLRSARRQPPRARRMACIGRRRRGSNKVR